MKKKRERRIAMLLAALMLIINLGISPVWAAPGDVSIMINEASFPDPIFRRYVSTNFDKDKSGSLSRDERDAVTEIVVANKNIGTLKGVKYFTKLKTLTCKLNKLTALDLSKNINLEALDCTTNQLNTLELTNNTKLKELYCSFNKLTALDLSNNTKLIYIYCARNQLAALDLKNNTAVTHFAGSKQERSVTVPESSRSLDLTTLATDFDPEKMSDLEGGAVSGNTLTLDSTKPSTATYKYNTGHGILIVKLNVNYSTEVFTVTFDANGGSGSMADVTKNAGETYVLPACAFTAPTGKEFKAWEVGGVEKAVGDSIAVNANTTVKALWKDKTPETYTITFDSNGGSGSMAAVTKNAGETYVLPACKFTAPAGKEFKAWEVGGAQKAVGDSITVNANTTVKALWKDKTPETYVEINEANFPDAYFRSYVRTNFDKDKNGVLSQGELDAVTQIDVVKKNITTLKGVEHFAKLKSLFCRGNQLTALDLTKNLKLNVLNCQSNQLTALNVTNNPKLEKLYCKDNKLTALDVTNNLELNVLVCDDNQLTSLDLTANTNITGLSGSDQKYTIEVRKSDLTFNLSSLPGNFDPLKASGWTGGTVSGNTLTLNDADTNEVTYKYEARSGKNIEVTLKVKFKETPPETVTITFNANGHGTAPADITVNKGETATAPADPTDADYDFGGWYKEAACTNKFDFTQAVNDDITLYAKWTKKTPPTPVTVTITFNANGHGTAPAPLTVNKGKQATAPADPTDADYDFGGWYKEAACTNKFDFTQAVNDDITLYAKWTKKTPPTPVTVTITFNANGHGTAPAPLTVNKGKQATAPADPTDADYDFGGWYKEAACTNKFDFTQAVNDDITLYAKWTKKTPPTPVTVTITFNANGHGTAPAPLTVNKGKQATAPADPTDADYDFAGWYTEAECTNAFDFTQAVNDNITLYAKWTKKTPPAPTQFTITFEANGGGGTMPVVTKNKDEKYALPDCGFTPPAGKEFKAWQVDGTEKNVGDEITVDGDKTVTAVWKDKGSVPPTPPVPPIPTPEPTPSPYPYPTPWIIYPSWYYANETPEPKKEPVKIDRKIVLTIGTNVVDRGLNGISTDIIMDVAPYIKEGRTMLPVRYVAEGLGFDVEWIESTRTVVLLDGTTKVEIPVDTDKIIVNGTVYTGDVKPEIKKGRTMLSIANIARALGLQDGKDIIWNDKSKTVTIYRTILVK